MIADAAQAVGGKLYVLGGGWHLTGPEPSPSAVLILFEFLDEPVGAPYRWRIALVEADGAPVMGETTEGPLPLVVEGGFEVPASTVAGAPAAVPIAINLGPIPLPAGSLLEWRVTIDGKARDDLTLRFATRKPGEG